MPRKRAIHVVTHSHGWTTKREGGNRAGYVHKTQREAIAKARGREHRDKVEVVATTRQKALGVNLELTLSVTLHQVTTTALPKGEES